MALRIEPGACVDVLTVDLPARSNPNPNPNCARVRLDAPSGAEAPTQHCLPRHACLYQTRWRCCSNPALPSMPRSPAPNLAMLRLEPGTFSDPSRPHRVVSVRTFPSLLRTLLAYSPSTAAPALATALSITSCFEPPRRSPCPRHCSISLLAWIPTASALALAAAVEQNSIFPL